MPLAIDAEPIIPIFSIGGHIAYILHGLIVKERVSSSSANSHKSRVICTIKYQKYIYLCLTVHRIINGMV